jgi:hypothetical protein
MKALRILAVLGVVHLGGVAPETSASLDLLRNAMDPNPALSSYTASAHLSAVLHVVVPIHKTVDGTVYYLKPKQKIEFAGLTGPLKRFKDLASSTPSFEEILQSYDVTPLSDEGGISTYSLKPKSRGGRVAMVSISVSDAFGLVTQIRWLYDGGGTLNFNETYTDVGPFRLATVVDIQARFPGYSVDGTLRFSNYLPNAPVPASVLP